MSKLQSPHKERIELIQKEATEQYSKGDYHECIKLLENAWDLFPEPKGSYSESFHFVQPISQIYLKLKDYDNARKWATILYDCAKSRADIGEREYLSGTIEYEAGDLEKAFQYFEIANKKSRGRAFGLGDKKYHQFYRERSK